MLAKFAPLVAIVVVVGLTAIMTTYYLPLMPERMAIHFGANDVATSIATALATQP